MSRDRFRKNFNAFFTRDKPNASREVELARKQLAPTIQGDAVAGPFIIGPLIKGGLNVLGNVLSDLGFPGASACNLVITAVEKYEATKSNVDALNSLKKHCNHIAGVIADALKDKTKLTGPIDAALKRFGSQLDVVVAPCEEAQKKHIFFKFIMSSDDAAKITEMFDELGRLIAAFVLEITLAGYFTVNKVLLAVEHKVLSDNIDKLKHVEAAYDSNHALNKKRTKCLAGTRTALLEKIGHWAVARNEKPIYLLTGHAGFGKSTIVRTVAERLDDLHILGASFFFSRDDAQFKSNSLFFSTLAYQLCLFDAGFAEVIVRALQLPQTRDAVAKSPATQLERLIVEPLKSLNDTSRTVIIVIDALDECEDFESPDGEMWHRDIWDGLATLVNELSFIRVFLTSRPHQYLTTLVANNDRLYTHQASIEASDPDISRYLRHMLIDTRDPSMEWIANDSEISTLEEMVAGLFIVAATVIRFILYSKKLSSPSDRIRGLTEAALDPTTRKPNNKGLFAVNDMYQKILNLSLSLDDDDPDELRLFQTIVGSIIFLPAQFNLERLAGFLGEDVAIIRNLINKLQAIIILTDDKPQFHKSFVDYITDEARSNELCIPPSHAHAVLAFRCFRALGDGVGGPGVIKYGAWNIEDHCATADPTILKRSLSDAQVGRCPSFWIEVACCLILVRSFVNATTRSTIVAYMDTSECAKEVVDILNLEIESKEVFSEETLRLILTSKSMEDDKIYESFGAPGFIATQYLKTLLHHLSNGGMWREHWICPAIRHCLWLYHVWARYKVNNNALLLDLALGNRGNGQWAGSRFEGIYRTFEPTIRARSILRQKLLEADLELAALIAEDEVYGYPMLYDYSIIEIAVGLGWPWRG